MLVTDHVRILHALVTTGAACNRPAASFLDKSVPLMPSIAQCLKSMEELLNQPEIQQATCTASTNDLLEDWRVQYSRQKPDRTK
ncbi:hypothetical protein AYM40_29195 [Paraburkholderia phytofirmans OLGA172]|uniref:Uncharacterized protein n=1 Tax=Paraburkholderia phytofirmans OLGA172 TaxID=1417228 RepID=A0A160FT44_9BURK|nr:hypothetical protein AYM40_29195 [Paraburkholderia phytofirmans OLGA172]